MRGYLFLLLFLQFLISKSLSSQVNNSDSGRIEPTRTTVERTVRQWQDSIERERLLRNIEQHGKSVDALLAERKEEEKKEERRKWVRIGAGVLFLFVFFISLGRRYRRRSESR